MSSQKILILDNNEIILTKSIKAKSIYISIRPFERVKVTIPFFVSFKKAEDFVKKKELWIRKSLLKIKSIEQKQTIFDFNTSFSTRYHMLKLNKVEINDIKYRLKDQVLSIDIPNCFLIVPSSAFLGSVAPITLLLDEIASSFSKTIATTGPDDKYSHKSL